MENDRKKQYLLQEDNTKKSHDTSGDSTCDGHCHNPGSKDISKQWPIDTLLRTDTTDGYDTSDFAVSSTDRYG